MDIVAGRAVRLRTNGIGDAWLAVAGRILADGAPSEWTGTPMRELRRVTLEVDAPDPADPVVARFADPERLAWMHANFTEHARVPALGDADSYATRLYDYAHSGRDQVAWVIARIRGDRTVRDATITTFQPLTDTSYVPCVSLLDFWLEHDRLQLGVYAHGIDFGTKGFANLVELAAIQHRVAAAVEAGLGRLTMTIKSAHVYDSELDPMRELVAAT
jgi:thymidylate synthase